MAATTGPIGERLRSIRVVEGIPVSAGVKINQGAYVVMNAGTLEPATSASGLAPLGIAPETYDNTDGADGDITGAVDFMRDRLVRGFLNSTAPNNFTIADLGGTAYLLDDQTVTKDSTSRTALPGKVLDVTSSTSDMGAFVWVEV